MDRITIEAAGVLLLATVIRTALGFGEALVAVPLLALLVPVEIAAPIAVLVSITVASIAVAMDWRHVQMRSAGWLVLSTLPGIPFGLWLLKAAPEPIIKSVLGVLIIGFSLFAPAGRKSNLLDTDRFAWAFGFSAGVLGGAYGMNGPPLAIYGSLRGWTPERFRATLQGYFLPASVIGMCGYWIGGLWTRQVSRMYLLALPEVLVGICLGRVLQRHLRGPRFSAYVRGGLLVIAGILLVQAYRF